MSALSQPVPQTTAVLDPVIRLREAALNRLAGVSKTAVLNPGLPEQAAPGSDLAAELRGGLNRLAAAALSADGTAVDYDALRHSPDYAAFRRDDLARLHTFQPAALADEAAQRAFWINLYNLLVLDAVIAWDVRDSVGAGRLGLLTFFRRAAYGVNGRRLSLDDIEHGILRANRGHPYVPGPHFTGDDPRRAWILPLDPRLHFALNCGGVSCPPIRAYDGPQLDAQLSLAARGFLDSSVSVDPAAGTVTFSELLKWYEGDFGGRAALLAFVAAHLPDDARRAYIEEENGRYRLRYTPYDWSLNAR